MNNGRELLIYLSIIHHGNRDKVVQDAASNKEYDYHEVKRVTNLVKCQTLTMIDPDYPSYLKGCFGAPVVLFYYGDISLINEENHKRNLAVVGTRDSTPYGRKHTRELVYGVAHACNIVSGLASGIDAEAHQAAIDARTKTIAVLGSGIDFPWPTVNTKLYHDIISNGGLVISEYAFKSEPYGFRFPIRNRLIVMFSKAVLITEAYGQRSGTSITATIAASVGKEVMCLPYPVEIVESFTNQLIYEGAKLIRNAEDVLLDMDLMQIKLI